MASRFRMTLAAGFAAICLAAPAAAAPPDPEALAAAQALTDEFFAGGAVEQYVAAAWPLVDKEIRRSSPDAAPETIAGLKSDYVKLASRLMSAVLADFPALYAKHFTADELKQLLAFYRTPIGRKSLDVMPALMREGMALSVARTPAFQRQLDQAFRSRLAEKGLTLPI